MSKEMVLRPYQPFELTEKQVTMIAHTSFVPEKKRGKIAEIWASIFAGRAMGIDDMTAINKIHVIEGTPSPSAHLASAVVRMRGHSLEITLNEDGTAATAVGVRADTGNRGTETFSLKDAETANLLGKKNWKQYPKAMLKARATTALCNSLFSDCFMGGVYTPDELGADFAPDEDVIDVKGEEVHEPIPDEAEREVAEPEEPSPAVTPWALLKQLAETAGVSREVLADVGAAKYPGRAPSTLSQHETLALWAAVEERMAEGAAT